MLNIQNNSYIITNAQILKRNSGDILIFWIETQTNVQYRAGVQVRNEDGTIKHATSYGTWVASSNTAVTVFQVLLDDSDNVFACHASGTTAVIYCDRFSPTLGFVGQFSGSASNVNYGFTWWDSSKTYIYMSQSGSNQVFFNKITNTIGNTTNPPPFPTYWANRWGHIECTSTRPLLYITGNGIVKKSPNTLGAAEIAFATVTGAGAMQNIFEGYNGIVYYFYLKTDNSICYRIIDATGSAMGAENILFPAGQQATSDLKRHASKFGTNKFIWSIISNANATNSLIMTQDLSTNLLTVDLTSSNTVTIPVAGSFSCIDSSANSYSLKNIDSVNLAQSAAIDISSGSGFTVSAINYPSNNVSMYCYKRPNWSGSQSTNQGYTKLMNVDQNVHSIFMANNGPSAAVNLNYQKTQVIFGYASLGTHKSTNTVANFTSFKVTTNKSVPVGTTLTARYSINNGSSWTSFALDTVITVTGTQMMLETTLTTSNPLITPEYMDYMLDLYV